PPLIASGALVAAALAACAAPRPLQNDAEVGLPVMAVRWTFQAGDSARESKPQEFASPASAVGPGGLDTLFFGSRAGTFYAVTADQGRILWKRELGSVSS